MCQEIIKNAYPPKIIGGGNINRDEIVYTMSIFR